jgi:hypothetical protein
MNPCPDPNPRRPSSHHRTANLAQPPLHTHHPDSQHRQRALPTDTHHQSAALTSAHYPPNSCHPDLTLLPWHNSPFTTPNKPAYVLAGYGWFYAGGFALTLALFHWFRRRYSTVPYIAALVITVVIPFYIWNLVTADGVSYLTNWFQYLQSIGPTIHTDKGGLQLVYQAVPTVISAVAVVASLDLRGHDGRTWFERALGVKPVITTWGQRLHQIVAWIAGMNLL